MSDLPNLESVELHLQTPVYQYHQHQGRTNDCGPTSLAIAANAILEDLRFHGPDVAQDMNDPVFEVRPFPRLFVRRIKNWATFPWGIVHYLRQNGIAARWSPFGTMRRLLRNLAEDRITIVLLGEPVRWRDGKYAGWAHAKILFGYDPNAGLLFVDPAYRQRTERPDTLAFHGLFWQDDDDFRRQWRWLLGTFIEVG